MDEAGDPHAESPQERIARRRVANARARRAETRRRLVLLGIAVAGLTATWTLAAVLGDLSGPTMPGDGFVHVPTAHGTATVAVAALATLLVALIALHRLCIGVPPALRALAATAWVLALPASCCHGCASSPSTLRGMTMTPVGALVYLRADDSTGPGIEFVPWIASPVHAIVAPAPGDFLADRYEIKACRSVDPDMGLNGRSLIGPAGHGGVLRTADDVVAVFIDGTCALAWDGRRRRVLWDGWNAREPFPVFALLGPGDEPSRADVARIVATARDARERARRSDLWPQFYERMDLPPDDEIVAALNDPRRAVREAAREIAKAGGPEMFPAASAAAATPR